MDGGDGKDPRFYLHRKCWTEMEERKVLSSTYSRKRILVFFFGGGNSEWGLNYSVILRESE